MFDGASFLTFPCELRREDGKRSIDRPEQLRDLLALQKSSTVALFRRLGDNSSVCDHVLSSNILTRLPEQCNQGASLEAWCTCIRSHRQNNQMESEKERGTHTLSKDSLSHMVSVNSSMLSHDLALMGTELGLWQLKSVSSPIYRLA